jgi:hypothetical protein
MDPDSYTNRSLYELIKPENTFHVPIDSPKWNLSIFFAESGTYYSRRHNTPDWNVCRTSPRKKPLYKRVIIEM